MKEFDVQYLILTQDYLDHVSMTSNADGPCDQKCSRMFADPIFYCDKCVENVASEKDLFSFVLMWYFAFCDILRAMYW